MRTIETTVYKFDELNEQAKERAIIDHINFEIEIMDENSPYFNRVAEMEENKTPWFLGSVIYEKDKESIIETIRINKYEFTEDGELI